MDKAIGCDCPEICKTCHCENGGKNKDKEENMINRGIFGNDTNYQDRLIGNYERLASFVEHCKGIGLKIVLTSGTFDLLHIGHLEYLEKAKKCGDILIVGVDSDEKVRKRKGPNRPVVPENERTLMLAHSRHVDVAVLKGHNDPKHHLIKTVKPDVLIISESTKHNDEDIEVIKGLCGEIKILEPQAQTSTTAKIRLLHVEGMSEFAKKLAADLPKFIEDRIREANGGEK